jgi:hypothetical protein
MLRPITVPVVPISAHRNAAIKILHACDAHQNALPPINPITTQTADDTHSGAGKNLAIASILLVSRT